jgi:hypothetical protein
MAFRRGFVERPSYPAVHAAATAVGLDPLNLVVWSKTNSRVGSLCELEDQFHPVSPTLSPPLSRAGFGIGRLPGERAGNDRRNWRQSAPAIRGYKGSADNAVVNHGALAGPEWRSWVAGAPGFEPGNGGTKNRCLTTWRRPIEARIHSRLPGR